MNELPSPPAWWTRGMRAAELDLMRVAEGDLNPEVAMDAARRRFARLDISEQAVETLAKGLLGQGAAP